MKKNINNALTGALVTGLATIAIMTLVPDWAGNAAVVSALVFFVTYMFIG